ncbi:hypothetical protein HG263_10835 [Pseudoalteromonas sp. JBTF-M23]|uniref:Uncharacterized protein n=1 Tax=Pseudoalteromonas caenipelagi TaxID=2726988 RepID=A0A849VE11_9GAMM|nr:hypothetical protein [Pseudoalteromonas caenipelagi]NOU51028.1 hypothetical protein [Pseudoalteromonas caenipelagi]
MFTHTKNNTRHLISNRTILIMLVLIVTLFSVSLLATPLPKAPSIRIDIPNTTQGPFWPPSAVVDEDGNYIVVGTLLVKQASGEVVPVPSQAAIVSKHTVPPLDENGREDFTNPFAAEYKVIRHLDLSAGSADLQLPLYANSYGPPRGHFGGIARVPMDADTKYNHNSLSQFPCPEIFPAKSQEFTYRRPLMPLHQVPISGFQGDQKAYDVDSGEVYIPNAKVGEHCPPLGCSGEDNIDERNNTVITLGQWLEAKMKLTITLADYDRQSKGYTAAVFQIKAKNMLPNAIYQVMAFRRNNFEGDQIKMLPDPLAVPPILLSDDKGKINFSRKINNPFPAIEHDEDGLRVIGLVLTYRSNFQTSGACALKLGPGVDIHAIGSTLNDFPNGIVDFITTKKQAHSH